MRGEPIPRASPMLCPQLPSPQWAVVVARMPTLASTDCSVLARTRPHPKKSFQHGSDGPPRKPKTKLCGSNYPSGSTPHHNVGSRNYRRICTYWTEGPFKNRKRACRFFSSSWLREEPFTTNQNLVHGCVHQRCIFLLYDIILYEIYDANHTS
jgi:hypothetical protein